MLSKGVVLFNDSKVAVLSAKIPATLLRVDALTLFNDCTNSKEAAGTIVGDREGETLGATGTDVGSTLGSKENK